MPVFTEKELEISNKSYTNKDFEAVYTELLSYAEKLSKRFSPATSNESDPFVILLKLVAFVTDKVNYNIDKNILERFMLSCTQNTSMRELTSLLGYNMRYYRSAETEIVFKYNFPNSYDGPDSIIIPQFSTILTADNIQYVTTVRATIEKSTGVSTAIPVIQGKLKTLNILESNLVQLENLNANNTLYLPEAMIAENGIYITSADVTEEWKAVSNLNTEVYGSACFKFGYDSSKNLPYLEFPSWIADIIGNGLTVKYLITEGVAGNIASRELVKVTRFFADSFDLTEDAIQAQKGIDDNEIIVINSFSASSGQDPETLDESYKGFKKIIGTFDTLVTCRDYANKIYNLLDLNGLPYVSNVQIGDRRKDINYSCDVLSATSVGTQTRSVISKKITGKVYSATNPNSVADIVGTEESLPDASCVNLYSIYQVGSNTPYYKIVVDELSKNGITYKWDMYNILPEPSAERKDEVYFIMDTYKYVVCKYINESIGWIWLEITEEEIPDIITPYDIIIYGLNPITNVSYLAINDQNGYNKAFNSVNKNVLTEIGIALEKVKTTNQIYKNLKNTDIVSIRNYYQLEATINTIRKVNTLEEKEIIININNALISKYNSRNLQFGCEIAFDELLATMENADSRIKSIGLQEPEQIPIIVLANNTEIPVYHPDGTASEQFKMIVAKNILSGRVSVFEYDKDFTYSYAYKDVHTKSNIISVSTSCDIGPFPPVTEDNPYSDYKLTANETIQFLAPRLLTKITYPYGINYYLKLQEGNCLQANAEYLLQDGDELIITYLNSDNETIITPYIGDSSLPLKDQIIIRSKNDLPTTAARVGTDTPTKAGVYNLMYPTEYRSASYAFYTLGANDEIEIRGVNSESLKTFKKCYWLTKHQDNEIPWSYNESKTFGEYILDDSEYFFYTDSALSSLYAFGSGTKLCINGANNHLDVIWRHNKYASVDSITEEGLSGLDDIFIGINFIDKFFTLDIYENEIITITDGDTLRVKNYDESGYNISPNIFSSVPDNIQLEYIYQGEKTPSKLSDRSSFAALENGFGWKARALLDINAGPNSVQIIKPNHKITYVTGLLDEIDRRYLPNPNAYSQNQLDINSNSVITIEGNIITLNGEIIGAHESIIRLSSTDSGDEYTEYTIKASYKGISNNIIGNDGDYRISWSDDAIQLYNAGTQLEIENGATVSLQNNNLSIIAKLKIEDLSGTSVVTIGSDGEVVSAREAISADQVWFTFNTPVHINGGVDINLQYLDLDLAYKCPKLLLFKYDAAVADTLQTYDNGYFGLNFRPLEIHTIEAATDSEVVEVPSSSVSRRLHVSPIGDKIIKYATEGVELSAEDNYGDDILRCEVLDSKTTYYKAKRICNVYGVENEHNYADETLHRYEWEEVALEHAYDRYIAIYLSDMDIEKGVAVSITAFDEDGASVDAIQKINTVEAHSSLKINSINLNPGLNIIRITEDNHGRQCTEVSITATAIIEEDRNKIFARISPLLVVKNINPCLGFGNDRESIFALFEYLKKEFPQQFATCNLLEAADNAKHITITEKYNMASAQAFYDPNNIANKWVIPKIDFANSSIKVARGSKK